MIDRCYQCGAVVDEYEDDLTFRDVLWVLAGWIHVKLLRFACWTLGVPR